MVKQITLLNIHKYMTSKYKQLRIILFYDLPMDDIEKQREYTRFRKQLIKLGFYQLQFSIYVKVVQNEMGYKTIQRQIKDWIPKVGSIRLLKITEKQYESMIFLRGKNTLHEQIIGDNQLVSFTREEFDEE